MLGVVHIPGRPATHLPDDTVLPGMSDFDEEKERERLREKYEQDKQKREASERMSELLDRKSVV